jgi:hypothetical protein
MEIEDEHVDLARSSRSSVRYTAIREKKRPITDDVFPFAAATALHTPTKNFEKQSLLFTPKSSRHTLP